VSANDYLAQNTTVYDLNARSYADTWFNQTNLRDSLRSFLSEIPVDGDILDAGCGPGRDVAQMLEAGRFAVGIDISIGMIEEARRRCPDGLFRKMDMSRLAYPPDVFSGIWSCASLVHVSPDQLKLTLGEFHRALKPDGILFLAVQEPPNGMEYETDSHGLHRWYHPLNRVRELLAQLDFILISTLKAVGASRSKTDQHVRIWTHFVAQKKDRQESGHSFAVDDCLLCDPSRFALNSQLKLPGSSSIVFANDDVFISPDIAPLAEGHLLISTNSHYLNFGATPEALSGGLVRAKEFVRETFDRCYNSDALFLEHGPARQKEAGACVDHAHLHCIPSDLDIKQVLDEHLEKCMPATIETLRSLWKMSSSYVYCEHLNSGSAYPVGVVPSQMLRLAIARAFGLNDWRWQDMCRKVEVQKRFMATLSKLIR
jgi:SAM-dependent methyltransferase/diadenosine tetraphosphate (Ap4A) HIT family hydrolase